MDSTTTIKHEYFELVKKLNQTNKLKNQDTDIRFYIDSVNPSHLKLFAAISDDQKILLCQKPKQSKWLASRYSQFPSLEIYIAQLLYYKEVQTDLTDYIKSHIFKLTN